MIQLLKNELKYLSTLHQVNFLSKSKTKWYQSFILVIFVYGIIDVIFSFSSWELVSFAFPIIEEADYDFKSMGLRAALIGAVIWAPLYEESAFRLVLKFSRSRWNFSILLLVLLLAPISVYLMFIGLAIWVALGILLMNRYFYSKFLFGLLKYKKLIFWVIVFLFGFIHLTNFDLELLPIYFYPLAVLPQLIGGVFLGVVRIRFGFWYGVLLHAFTNSIAIIATFYLG
ncbi:CPBP family glutamic-type intramembrane protease [Mongoliibacter ruber]|uniref:CAAX prenyl protease-like protein n=1 Tax=Mongoliibacter ruber TaxID=1750599 RepID=A0A2T0WUH5_9BACT|nr:CPBP family glutamic-type intramembrane protease [Mongoliibacter ruber]PRY90353.1 CAAX prenyl protease-like protein [Mongoliibacter ruber]